MLRAGGPSLGEEEKSDIALGHVKIITWVTVFKAEAPLERHTRNCGKSHDGDAENPRRVPGQIRKIPEKSGKSQKGQKKEGQVQIGKPSPFEKPPPFIDTEYDRTKVPPYNGSDPRPPLEG